ncbi:uncharacterized protein LOC143636773 [Bidens hawaiensis]|uniref:uncharacterized protein LOC143636773 n=1 Tax=Bidens hawaiensis TaxID=980011 RepID=UPI00404A63EE
MPFHDDDSIAASTNRFMNKELAYDTEVMTDEQRNVYNEIMEEVDENKGGVFFVYGYGGTGKTFLWKTLSASIGSKAKIVLNVKPQDETPMIHKHAFESLDRSLKDVLKGVHRYSSQHPFGKVIVFGGDFRQILPVVQNGSRSDIVNASLNLSHIWSKCKVLRLTKNMRLTVGCHPSDLVETSQFADWLLERGKGKLGGHNDGNSIIDISDDLLIGFDGIDNSDSVGPGYDPALHIPDFLNGLKMSEMPNHKLVLKFGVPIMLLRNIDQKNGLCNGTRLQVIQLGRCFIEVKVISGTNIGHRIYITRSTPSDKKLSFKLKRRQFPVAVCFAMTINKS